MPIRTSVKDQSVLQKRAAAGAILRSMGLGGGIHPTSKSIFWAQDAQLAGFCQYSFRYGYIVEKSLFFSFRFAIYDMYLSLFIWKYLSFFLKPEINLQVFLLWSPWKGEIFLKFLPMCEITLHTSLLWSRWKGKTGWNPLVLRLLRTLKTEHQCCRYVLL